MSETTDPRIQTWFLASCYRWGDGRIDEVRVDNFTEKTISIVGGSKSRRKNRVSDYEAYYPTREQAIGKLFSEMQRKAEYHEKQAATYRLRQQHWGKAK